MAKIHPRGLKPQITRPIRAQIKPGVVRPTVWASRKKLSNQRDWVSSPTAVPISSERPKPIPIRVRVAPKLEKRRPVPQISPKVRTMRIGPGRRFSSRIQPEASSHRPRTTT